MAWKNVHISQPTRLSLADGQIVVVQDVGETRFPIEDVACVIIDEPRVTLTTALVSACMDAGVALIVTDARHMPNGVALPFHAHSRQAEIAARQVAMKEPLRKQCWRRVIRAKILNQAAHLAFQQCEGDASMQLREQTKMVRSGDPENIEAWAARLYWGALFNDFRRVDETDIRNAALNYVYAVLRAGVARSLVAHGLFPGLGVHHANGGNAFNLADDLIEPFRPFADRLVARLLENGLLDPDQTGLSLEVRRGLAGILLETCAIGAWERIDLRVAIEAMTQSFQRVVMESDASRLVLPEFRTDEPHE